MSLANILIKKLDKRELPRGIGEGLKTRKLKSKGQKRATVGTSRRHLPRGLEATGLSPVRRGPAPASMIFLMCP